MGHSVYARLCKLLISIVVIAAVVAVLCCCTFYDALWTKPFVTNRDVAQFKDGVKIIAMSLLLITRSTLSTNEFTLEEFSRQSIFRHPNYMADPSQLLRDNKKNIYIHIYSHTYTYNIWIYIFSWLFNLIIELNSVIVYISFNIHVM